MFLMTPPWLRSRYVSSLALTAALVGCAGKDDTGSVDPLFPSVETVGDFTILRLEGTPAEMGRQHAELLREELLEAGAWLDTSELALLEPLAAMHSLDKEALANSYPDVVEECQGLADALADVSWDMNRCMLLAYGDVVVEVLAHEFSCSQFVASGVASVGGETVHARNLDWMKLDYIIEHPTLIVRKPTDGIPNVVLGFPGNISPYSGMNAEGIAIASNEATGTAYPDGLGHPHTQMARKILTTSHSLSDARSLLEGEDHVSAEILVISDGNSGEGAVFEMAADGMATRTLSPDGLVYVTNHFIDPSVEALNEAPLPEDGTATRYARLAELLEPGGKDSIHGRIDAELAVNGVLRDTYNPVSGETFPQELFDGGGTLANNGAIQSLVFLPERRWLYVASGAIPIPANPYTGFTMDWLLGLSAENEASPASLGLITR